MRKYDGRLVGILGTVIIHLIVGILFMSFQISSLRKNSSKEFLVELIPVEDPQPKPKVVELPATTIERVLKGDQEMLNIARNLSNKSDQNISAADYIEKVKEELIQSGKLGADNYIDAQKRLSGNTGDEKLSSQKDSSEMKDREKEKPKVSNEIAANYKGPTRIYYDLKGRTHAYLPIPIYLCQGSGTVVLSIEVNQKGEVERAQIVSGESTTSDLCLIETAVSTALMSRFNPDIKSPKSQTGTLSYQFVAQ